MYDYVWMCPPENGKAAHPKNHTTALSTGIKANHPRLRDGCSNHRVKVTIENIKLGSQIYLIKATRGLLATDHQWPWQTRGYGQELDADVP
ncbi:hypothetical protein TNCV_1149011 [Trichonephila clavipes]|nr:hypothetical protein TNCV_1149011 [Trichonephila clavipes]